MAKLQLEVLTPRRRLLETEADQVTLPGELGEMSILPQHIPLVTMLGSGVLAYQKDSRPHYIAVQSGYAQVEADQITVLVEHAALAEEIDLAVAEQDAKEASEHLKQLLSKSKAHDPDAEAQQQRASAYEAQLLWAITRQMASRYK